MSAICVTSLTGSSVQPLLLPADIVSQTQLDFQRRWTFKLSVE
jgi:hypothetical protein